VSSLLLVYLAEIARRLGDPGSQRGALFEGQWSGALRRWGVYEALSRRRLAWRGTEALE
jgi:hypothetical protein